MIHRLNDRCARLWVGIESRFLPIASAMGRDLPWPKLLRLSLIQVTVGMAVVLVIGTLNRVMIVELGLSASLVSAMIALPLMLAPARAFVGFRSDNHRSALGWRRVPYIWIGTLLQFGGLAIMPFALILLSGDRTGPEVVGQMGAALAFLLVGAGLHTTQTAGLALACDLGPDAKRPRIVAIMCLALFIGMAVSATLFGLLLTPFGEVRLIQVVQGAGLVTVALNIIALWKQEGANRAPVTAAASGFASAWARFSGAGAGRRRLLAVAMGTAAFAMQDVLLEPYGGQILGLSVGATTALTASLALGGIGAFALAGRWLARGANPYRLAAMGVLVGIVAFAAVIFAAPVDSAALFGVGVLLIGFGGGLFAVSTLAAFMGLGRSGEGGLAMGAWGAAQSLAAGLATVTGGVLRDTFGYLAAQGRLGEALSGPEIGYSIVYHIEVALLFATLIALGPLVRHQALTPAIAPPDLVPNAY